jgi:putative ABC transport system permease protein
VILLIAGNTMAQAVRERTSELGVLKTLGFSDLKVMLLVMIESLLLSVVGGGLGLALIWLLAPGLYPLVQMFLPVFYVPSAAIGFGLLLAVALGAVSGAIPAWNAMRLRIVDALRRS